MEDRYSYFFKCFSHKSRLKIIRLLAQCGEMTVKEMADSMEIKASTISRHLNILTIQGILQMRVDAACHLYSLNREKIAGEFESFLSSLDLETAAGSI